MSQLDFDLGERTKDIQIYRGHPAEHTLGGGLEGAERMSRETANWNVAPIPPDRAINTVKEPADARAKDMVINDGYARGAVQSHMDSVIGGHYRLNAKIDWKTLQDLGFSGATREWAENAQAIIERRFSLIAESEACYLDAAGLNTFTGILRLAVAGFVMTGEVLMTSEWDQAVNRPLKTCFQMVDPTRLQNPDWATDTASIRRGVKVNRWGKPLGYYIRKFHPYSYYPDPGLLDIAFIPAVKPWGRPQVIHIIEQLFPDQHRGIADMVAALKRMRMTKHLQEVVLQNAVINATYCAAIESEMPTAEMITTLGGDSPGPESITNAIGAYMTGLNKYLSGSENIALDGAMIPHLYPGTKLNMKTLGTPGSVGTEFEQSLLRHTAAALGLDYAEFSRDYSRMSYATAKLSDAKTQRFMMSRKKSVADRTANMMYGNVVEEMVARQDFPLAPGMSRDDFYSPLVREALTRANWIGGGRGQIDELKETQAAMMRVRAGFSTREAEIARLGHDYREVFDQLEKEDGMMAERGILLDLNTNKSNTGQGGATGQSAAQPDTTDEDADAERQREEGDDA